MTVETRSGLISEYQAKLSMYGLPQLSADELIHETLTDEQRAYVSSFIIRWEALESHLDEMEEDIRELDTGMDPGLVRELLEEYQRLNGELPSGFVLST